MLNFIYYPVSWVMLAWYKFFGLFLNPDSGVTWALSIIFLVFTIRIFLFKPMANQMRSGRKMQELQPKMQEIRAKYKNDQQTQAIEMRKLQKEMGVNPLASCLPALVQMPIFISLYHVLRSFNRTGTGHGELGMTVEQTRNTPNYGFGATEVQSFLDARLFGAPLSAYIRMPEKAFDAFSASGSVDFIRTNILVVAIPLMIISALATHFNARNMVRRNKARQAADPKKNAQNPQMAMQANMMNNMMLWLFPAMILITGMFWQIGLLTYMLANNVWTLGQQIVLFNKMDREEEEEKKAKAEAQRATAPKVGQKPKNNKKKGGKKKK